MQYISTRGKATPKPFKDILLEGLAEDGGLYMPATYPKLDLAKLRGKSYQSVAFNVLRVFMDDIPPETLNNIILATYTAETFGSPDITPLKLLEPGLALLQLANGPTLAFKDVPLQLVCNLMEYVLEERDQYLNLYGATSGDTGSAAEYAARGKKRLKVFMHSPIGRMSVFQAKQMYTLNEPNIFNLPLDCPFDDCQSLVKEVNGDAEFKRKYNIGAVNSINWARIAAQVVYYVYAYLQMTKRNSEQVDFAVPSGNFGNALAAHVARQMGLPIRHIIVANNENDVLHEFFTTGTYRVRKSEDVVVTSSPSMDIASASNFERLIFDALEQNAGLVSELWDEIVKKGNFKARILSERFASSWRSGCAIQADVDFTIRFVYENYGIIIDPHTAVAMCIGLLRRSPEVPLIIAETAQPAKFEDTIQRILKLKPPVPNGFEHLAELPEHTHRIEPTAAAVKEFIAAHAG